MNYDNKRLLSRAFSEAFEKKYAAAKESSGMTVLAVRDFRAEYMRRRKHPFVVAACFLLAVAIACSCTWSNYRESFGSYQIEYLSEGIRVFDPNVSVEMSSSRPDYTLGYVPDGYELVEETDTIYHTGREWKNDEGKIIRFRQPSSSGVGNYDNNLTQKHVFDHNGTEVLHLELRDKYDVYIYRIDGYNMVILSDGGLSEETFLQMIDATVLKS
ncbi:MAG: DUF4367 domain-containing protein [Clostridia bacterium]|nr:DUF4367 domain-containing protein [Clostridia bacterium]